MGRPCGVLMCSITPTSGAAPFLFHSGGCWWGVLVRCVGVFLCVCFCSSWDPYQLGSYNPYKWSYNINNPIIGPKLHGFLGVLFHPTTGGQQKQTSTYNCFFFGLPCRKGIELMEVCATMSVFFFSIQRPCSHENRSLICFYYLQPGTCWR